MSFADDVKRFAVTVETRSRDVFVGTAAAAKDSIAIGSPVTAAPGQPVDTGTLRNSWQLTYEGATTALISTNVVYAPNIEDGVGEYWKGAPKTLTSVPLTLRSQVGGFHSVKLTVAGMQRLVDQTVLRVASEALERSRIPRAGGGT